MFWMGSHKVGKMYRHRKSLLHFSGYCAMVSSGFFLLSGVLTSQGKRNILELEHINYRESINEEEKKVKEAILNWKYPKDNNFILEGGCFFLILRKQNYSSH